MQNLLTLQKFKEKWILNKLEPLRTSNVWKEQIKALINLIPRVGGAIAQEIQVIENYKTAEFSGNLQNIYLGYLILQ